MMQRKSIPEEIRQHLKYYHETGDLIWLTGKTHNRRPGFVAGGVCCGYMIIHFKRIKYRASRVAWFLYYNEQPPDVIDHIDRNKLNNRISNLRAASDASNVCNRGLQKNNSTGVKGVSFIKAKNRFRAAIGVKNKLIQIGEYLTIEEAEMAVNNAREKLHGQFACYQ